MGRTVFVISFCAWFLTGCVGEAPRDNPSDPLSPSFKEEGSLSGRVIVENQSTGIAGVTVTELSDSISVLTDSAGYFSFGTLSEGSHQFVCTKSNFANDTFTVTIASGKNVNVVRQLNGAPVVLMQSILTRKIDQYFPSPQYFVDISAAVTDPNGVADLDSVWFKVDTLKYPLSYSVDSKTFITTIYKYDIPTNTIQWLVGKPLTIVSKDVHGAVSTGDPFYITRVIENEATPISPAPANSDTVSVDSLTFTWSPPNVTFNYSYTITVYRVDGGTKTLAWTYENLDSYYEELRYSDNGSIVAGNHVWTISVVDEFGNYARSKESSFVVK